MNSAWLMYKLYKYQQLWILTVKYGRPWWLHLSVGTFWHCMPGVPYPKHPWHRPDPKPCCGWLWVRNRQDVFQATFPKRQVTLVTPLKLLLLVRLSHASLYRHLPWHWNIPANRLKSSSHEVTAYVKSLSLSPGKLLSPLVGQEILTACTTAFRERLKNWGE